MMSLNLTSRRIHQRKMSKPAPKKFQKLSGTIPFLQTYLLIPSSPDIYPASYGNVRDPSLPSEYYPLAGRAYQSYHINSSFTFGQPHFRKRYASTSFSYSYSPSHGFNADKANMSIDTNRPNFTLTQREIGPPEGFAYFLYILAYNAEA